MGIFSGIVFSVKVTGLALVVATLGWLLLQTRHDGKWMKALYNAGLYVVGFALVYVCLVIFTRSGVTSNFYTSGLNGHSLDAGMAFKSLAGNLLGFGILAGFYPLSIWSRGTESDQKLRPAKVFLLIATVVIIGMSVINDAVSHNWRVHERYWYVFIPDIIGLWLCSSPNLQDKAASRAVKLLPIILVVVGVLTLPFYAQGWSMTDAPSLIVVTAMVRKFGIHISMVLAGVLLLVWFVAWGSAHRNRMRGGIPSLPLVTLSAILLCLTLGGAWAQVLSNEKMYSSYQDLLPTAWKEKSIPVLHVIVGNSLNPRTVWMYEAKSPIALKIYGVNGSGFDGWSIRTLPSRLTPGYWISLSTQMSLPGRNGVSVPTETYVNVR